MKPISVFIDKCARGKRTVSIVEMGSAVAETKLNDL